MREPRIEDYTKFKKEAQERLANHAMCNGANPKLFDQIEHNEYAEAALNHCKVCKVAEECLLIVNPTRTFFDGVAGGIVFKEGKIVPKEIQIRFRERSL